MIFWRVAIYLVLLIPTDLDRHQLVLELLAAFPAATNDDDDDKRVEGRKELTYQPRYCMKRSHPNRHGCGLIICNL